MALTEELIAAVFTNCLPEYPQLSLPFPRLTYSQAMEKVKQFGNVEPSFPSLFFSMDQINQILVLAWRYSREVLYCADNSTSQCCVVHWLIQAMAHQLIRWHLTVWLTVYEIDWFQNSPLEGCVPDVSLDYKHNCLAYCSHGFLLMQHSQQSVTSSSHSSCQL